jgi:uncharacterized protein YjbI with pentapeptide repeats
LVFGEEESWFAVDTLVLSPGCQKVLKHALVVTRKQQLALLRRGVRAWNVWRFEDSTVEVNLRGVDLRGADLRGVDFRRANLRGADLREAFLSEADFYEADLTKADFTKAILRRANFNKAVLRKVDLSRADLYRADFYGAKVQQAFFSNNPGLTDKEKADLMERGAVFQDSPESHISV